MILSDREIEAALRHNQIKIDPEPTKALWTSTAIDLTLDSGLVRWKEPKDLGTGVGPRPIQVSPADRNFNIMNMLKNNELAEEIKIDGEGHRFGPRQFILGYTKERICLPHSSRLAARVEGKSSLARLGVGVHVTAPTIHAGFGYRGARPGEPEPEQLGLPIQLEIFNLGNFEVLLTAGMPICQLILEEVREAPNKGYHGRFSEQQHIK